MLWTLDEVVADNIFIFGNDPRFVKDNLKEEVTGSDLDDTDDYYDTSDDSDDEESVANIDDGLLDAVFDELPGKMQQKNIEKIMKTKQSVHIKTFNFNQIFFQEPVKHDLQPRQDQNLLFQLYLVQVPWQDIWYLWPIIFLFIKSFFSGCPTCPTFPQSQGGGFYYCIMGGKKLFKMRYYHGRPHLIKADRSFSIPRSGQSNDKM